jgi:hypothetical protein
MKKLRAGSLYKNWLVLYDKTGTTDGSMNCIQIEDNDLLWDIYCNYVDFLPIGDSLALVIFKDKQYEFKFINSINPMKDLEFIQ